MLKTLTALSIAFVLSVAILPTQVRADEVSQQQEQSYEVVCTNSSSSYGQGTCVVKGTQSQEQHVRRADGKVVRVHKPVNTGLPSLEIIAIVSIVILGLGTIAWKYR